MKKIIALLLSLLLALSLAACGSTGGGTPAATTASENLEGSLEELINRIYDATEADDSFKDWLKEGTAFTEITADNSDYFLGSKDIDFEEALASESQISPSAFSVCLVRLKDGADIDAVKESIKTNIDPNKWICVGVEEDQIIVDSIGNVVILIMSEKADVLHTAFLSLKQ